MKKVFCLIITAAVLLNLCVAAYSTSKDAVDNSAYYNQAYEDRLKQLENSSYDMSDITAAPSKYSYNEKYEGSTARLLRSYSGSSYETPESKGLTSEDVGMSINSNYAGWSFAANDALEIYLKKNDLFESGNFSEQHLLAATSRSVVDKSYGSRDGFYDAGNFATASAYWMRNDLSGPTTLPAYNCEKVSTYAEIKDIEKEPYYVTDTIELSDLEGRYASQTAIDERIQSIKDMVFDYGSVFAQYDHFDGAFDPYYKAYNNYNGGEIQTGTNVLSGIVIVGWDDNYAVSNFGENKPDNPGAFKVITDRKGDQGRDEPKAFGSYYLSYEMVPYLMGCSSITKAYNGNYKRYTYEYDKKAHKGVAKSTGTTNVYANKYKNTYGEPQNIKAITTYCEVPGSYFNIYISKDGNMQSLEKEENQKYSGNMGYVTFELKNPVKIETGKEFTVAIEVTAPTKGAESIPQEVSPVTNSSISGRCFTANDIESIKSGSYTDCGSKNNIIKVHVDSPNRQWTFDDAAFKSVQNSSVTTSTQIDGLTANKGIRFTNSLRLITGVKLNNYAELNKSSDYKTNSLKFYVNGTSKIYLIGKSNNETSTRRIAVYSEATKKTEYVNVDEARGYCYTYKGGAGYIYIYSPDNTIRLYSLAVEDFDEEEEIDTIYKKWDFSALYKDMINTETRGTINTNVEHDGIYLYGTQTKPMEVISNESTSKNGYRYSYGVNLNGSGTDTYRTIGFDVGVYADIYITARSSGTDNRQLYVTNKYYCDLESDMEGNTITVTPDIDTYKIQYYGSGERIFIRSADDDIRIITIVVKYREGGSADEHPFEPDNISELTVGSSITDKTVNGYQITGVNRRYPTVIASNVGEYTKAVRLISGEHFNKTSKIAFDVGTSDGSKNYYPNRKIRVKAKANATQNVNLRLVLGNEYGLVVDSKPMTNELTEYVFDYKGNKDRLYLFVFGGYSQDTADIYSISKTDVNYYTDEKTITVTRDQNGEGRCILSVDNVPDLSQYVYKLNYNKNELQYVGCEKITGTGSDSLALNNFSVINSSSGYVTFSAAYSTEKYNWSGIIGNVKFKFIGDTASSDVTLTMNKR